MADNKTGLRRQILARRRARSPQERAAAGHGIWEQVLAGGLVPARGMLATYEPLRDEPDTGFLVRELGDSRQLVVPVVEPDGDLSWQGRGTVQASTYPPAAITEAGLVLCPGLAGDRAGRRLGRGGGSYDRVLKRLGRPAIVCLLLYDDEVLDEVPTEPHDERIGWIATPTRLIRTDV